MTDEVTQTQSSRIHRFQVGDVVEYVDESEWPPTKLEGKIVGFDNEEQTYLIIDFETVGKKTLTEDEVRRIA